MVHRRIDVPDPSGIDWSDRGAMAAIIVICLATIVGFMAVVVYLLNTPPEEDSDKNGT